MNRSAQNIIIPLFVQDSTKTDGSGLTTLTYTSTGLTIEYKFETDNAFTSVSGGTIVTKSVGQWISNGFCPISGGNYEYGLPNTSRGTNRWVMVRFSGVTGMAVTPILIPLTAFDEQDSKSGGLGALADVGGLAYASIMEAMLAVLTGKATVSGNTVSYMKTDGTTTKVAVTFDSLGNRSASTIS